MSLLIIYSGICVVFVIVIVCEYDICGQNIVQFSYLSSGEFVICIASPIEFSAFVVMSLFTVSQYFISIVIS